MMFTHPARNVSEPDDRCRVVLKACLVASLFVIMCLGSSCEGFFVDPTVTAIAVTPPTPAITQNKTQQMAATASHDDGSVNDIGERPYGSNCFVQRNWNICRWR